MKKYLLLLIIGLIIASFAAGCGEDCTEECEESRHVLIIGIDGVRPDALRKAETPNLDALIAGGAVSYDAYAGGERRTVTQQATSSGPGWSSILTGVWLDKHNVPNNDFSDPNFDEYPCLFTRIRELRPDAVLASIVNWTPINDEIVDDADYEDRGDDAAVALLAADYLASQDPDVLFLQFDEVDGAGHDNFFAPWSPKYVEAIEITDAQVGQVMDALRARPRYDDEEWLVIVTTDHGGNPVFGHGSHLRLSRTIFMIVSGEAAAGGEFSPGPGMVAVPPTALAFLGLAIDPAWGWASEPFGLAD